MKLDTKSIVIDIITGRFSELNGDEYLTFDISSIFESNIMNIKIKDIIEIEEVFIK